MNEAAPVDDPHEVSLSLDEQPSRYREQGHDNRRQGREQADQQTGSTQAHEENGDELTPPEAEKEYSVNIYERIDEEPYQFGCCPVCSTLFDYDRSLLGKTVRCRNCNAPMRLVEAVEGELDV